MFKNEAIRYFNTARAISKLLEIDESAVSRWKEVIPYKRAKALREASYNHIPMYLEEHYPSKI